MWRSSRFISSSVSGKKSTVVARSRLLEIRAAPCRYHHRVGAWRMSTFASTVLIDSSRHCHSAAHTTASSATTPAFERRSRKRYQERNRSSIIASGGLRRPSSETTDALRFCCNVQRRIKLIPWTGATSAMMFPVTTVTVQTNGGFLLQQRHHHQRRGMTTKSSDKECQNREPQRQHGSSSNLNKKSAGNNRNEEHIKLKEKGEEPSSSASPPPPLPQALEARIKTMVDDLNLGDQLSVIFIATLVTLIFAAPYAVRHMKRSNDPTYHQEWTTTGDDPVEDFNRWWQQHYRDVMIVIDGDGDGDADGKRGGDNPDGDGDGKRPPQNAVEYMLHDVLRSKALKQAAERFLINILQSDEFKAAVQRLVKELWTDLVTDPETVAQVIQLLQRAIQNPSVREAARQLVLDLVEDPEVKGSLLALLERLGRDDRVRGATVQLLSDSAHATLNDVEVLDHSMEFATDVLGDDIVQRTAGEALRNTVSHALLAHVPPASIALAAAGIALLVFGTVAFGYARSSEQEAAVLEIAARSLHSRASDACFRFFVEWPSQAASRFASGAVELVAGPFRFVMSLPGRMLAATRDAVVDRSARLAALPGWGWNWFWRNAAATWRSLELFVYKVAERTALASGFWVEDVVHALRAALSRAAAGTLAWLTSARKRFENLTSASEQLAALPGRLWHWIWRHATAALRSLGLFSVRVTERAARAAGFWVEDAACAVWDALVRAWGETVAWLVSAWKHSTQVATSASLELPTVLAEAAAYMQQIVKDWIWYLQLLLASTRGSNQS